MSYYIILILLKVLEEKKKKIQVAEDWHGFKVQEFWFKQWLCFTRKIHDKTHKKIMEAESYYNRYLLNA